MKHIYFQRGGDCMCVAGNKQAASRLLQLPIADIDRMQDDDSLTLIDDHDEESHCVKTAKEICDDWGNGEDFIIPTDN